MSDLNKSKIYRLFLLRNQSILFNYHLEDFVEDGLEYNIENDGSFFPRDEPLLLEKNSLIFATDVGVIYLGYRTKPVVLHNEIL